MLSMLWRVLVVLYVAAAVACAGEPLPDPEYPSESEPSTPPERTVSMSRLSSSDGTTTLFVYRSSQVQRDDEWVTRAETPLDHSSYVLTVPGVAGDFHGVTNADGLITWPVPLSQEQLQAAQVAPAADVSFCERASPPGERGACVVQDSLSNEPATSDEARAYRRTVELAFTDPCAPRNLVATEASIEMTSCEDVTAVMSLSGDPRWNCYLKREVRCVEPPLTGPFGPLQFAIIHGDDVDELQRKFKETLKDCRLVTQVGLDAGSGSTSVVGMAWACDSPSPPPSMKDFSWQ